MTTGKSKADFPGAYIPFDKAVGPVPTVSIDSAPTVQLCINEDWLPFVVGALKSLTRPETWDDTYDNSVVASSEIAALISSYQEGCGAIVPSIMCASGSFKDLDYGFVPSPGSECNATWTPGVGWQMCCDDTPQGFLFITREFGVETLIRSVYLLIDTTAPYLISYDIQLFHDGDFISIDHNDATAGPHIVVDVGDLNQPATALLILIHEVLGGCAADTVVTDWKLCYTGAFPMSIAPDTWTIVKDFTTGDGGFVAVVSPGDGQPRAVYHAGVGWGKCTATTCETSDSSELRITKGLAVDARFTSVKIFYTATDDYSGATLDFSVSVSLPASDTDTTIACDVTTDKMRTDLAGPAFSANIFITKMIFSGVGPKPTDL